MSNNEQDLEQIKEVVQLYFDALNKHDFNKIEEAFWLEAKILGMAPNNEFTINTTDNWKERFQEPPNVELEKRTKTLIENIDISGNVAIAKAKWIISETSGIFEVTDYLSLLRINNIWKIVNKSWSVEKK
jgi:hypothetical protein